MGSNGTGESTVFVELILSAIKEALIDAVDRCDRDMGKGELRWAKIKDYLLLYLLSFFL